MPHLYSATLPPDAVHLPEYGVHVCPDGRFYKKNPLSKNPQSTYYEMKGALSKRNGVVTLYLSVGGRRIGIYACRLVARTFVPNPDNLPRILHIDGNPSNNAATNLRWVSCQEIFRNSSTGRRTIALYGGVLRKYVKGTAIHDDETRAAQRAYYALHKESFKAAVYKYYTTHKDVFKKAMRKYHDKLKASTERSNPNHD